MRDHHASASRMPEPAPLFADGSPLRVGYARCGPGGEELSRQVDGLTAAGCARIFTETVTSRAGARHEFAAAVEFCHRQTADRHESVILTVCEMRRLGRGALEFLAAAEQLRDHTIWLEILAGPLCGIHSPHPGDSALFDFASALVALEHDHAEAKVRDRREAARENGRQGGRPKILGDDMAATARELKSQGVPVAEIAQRLVIPDGKRKGQHPSVATVYRLLATRTDVADQSENITSPPAETFTHNIDSPSGEIEEDNAGAPAMPVEPTFAVDIAAADYGPGYIRGGGVRPRSRHRLKTRYDVPEAVVCPQCGRASEATHASAGEMSADLQFVWLEYAPDAPGGPLVATAHCRGCQPRAVFTVECGEVFCEAGPFLGGLLAEQAKATRSVPPAAKAWLQDRGWMFESWTMQCPEHPIQYGIRRGPTGAHSH